MKIVAEEKGIVGNSPDDQWQAFQSLLDWAVHTVAPAQGGKVEIELPAGRIWHSQPFGLWSMASTLTLWSRGVTTFSRSGDFGPSVHATGMPQMRWENIAFENLAGMTKNSGPLVRLTSCYEFSAENVHLIEGFRGLELIDCAGVDWWGGKIKGGKLISIDPAIGCAPGAFLVALLEGGSGNNSIKFHGVAIDPTRTDAIIADRMTYEAAILIRACDGYDHFGGHIAGGKRAHVMVEGTGLPGAPAFGISFHGSWIDMGSDATFLITGNELVQSVRLNQTTLQGGLRNFVCENPKAAGVFLNQIVNEFASHEGIVVSAGRNIQINGGDVRGNNALSKDANMLFTGPDTRNVQITGVRANANNTRANALFSNGAAGAGVVGMMTSGAILPVAVESGASGIKEFATVFAVA